MNKEEKNQKMFDLQKRLTTLIPKPQFGNAIFRYKARAL
jgi:hypothetical protein